MNAINRSPLLFPAEIVCSALSWEVTSSSIQTVLLSEIVSKGEANNGSQTQVVPNNNGNLSFTLLYPGAEYTLTLWFEKDSKKLPLCEQVETVGESVSYFVKVTYCV